MAGTVRNQPVVAIDGPAGSGKTTVARKVASSLGYTLIDTGALYRCVAYQAYQQGVSNNNPEQLREVAAALKVQFKEGEDRQQVWLNGLNVTDQIRQPHISQQASLVSIHPEVREALLSIQRKFGRHGGVVMEGRDIGTVVFPDAEVKIFLEAPARVRAQRRFRELKPGQAAISLENTFQELKQRDQRDRQRRFAPLIPAEDALIIDTEVMTADQVAEQVVVEVKKYLQSRLTRQ